MKHLFFALFSLIFLAGCEKKKEAEPQDQAKASAKPIAPVSKQEPPKTSPKTTAKKPGTVLWEFETGSWVQSSPAIGSDGTVYVGSWDHKLYAINGKSGVKLWEFKTGSYVFSSPAIGSDGTVYVGSNDKKLYAIKTDSKGLAKSPWPMRGQNPQHTGRAP
jgi:hypothetical protein